jgi:hypothetical protein
MNIDSVSVLLPKAGQQPLLGLSSAGLYADLPDTCRVLTGVTVGGMLVTLSCAEGGTDDGT